MEKAILKTLIYADIFDYPLKINEIHKWLIGRKVTVRQVEKGLSVLHQARRVESQGRFYFLKRRYGLVAQRRRRERQSTSYLRKAKIISQIFKMIPWIKLVGISGGLAMGNTKKTDDIDLFVITARKRLWISRLACLGLLSLIGQRRRVGEKGRKIAGKLCMNILLEEDKSEQKNKDIFVAHEVLQMKVLWQRDGVYSKYLEDNSWVFRFLPNWVGDDFGRQPRSLARGRKRPASRQRRDSDTLADARLGLAAFGGSLSLAIEVLAKKLQLKIMKKPQGLERIEDGALYFHPQDCRLEVLSKYRQKLKTVIS